MIGGKVIEVCDVPGRPDVLFVNVADRPYKKIETCGVLVEKNKVSGQIQIGDTLWWQSGNCYWTPQGTTDGRCGVDIDIIVKKRSGSGVTLESVSKSETD